MAKRSETNANRYAEYVAASFVSSPEHRIHHNSQTAFVQGRWQVQCLDCKAVWRAVDVADPAITDGFGLEQVAEGDHFCEEEAA